MFRQIFGFELRYQLRRPATWLYFAILFLLAFGFLSSDAVEIGGGRGKVLKNAPWVLANTTAILTAVGQVITSALVGTAILRDFQTRTHELLFTTAMSRFGYLADVFVLESARGAGLGKAIVAAVVGRSPRIRWVLFTDDAHGLYRQHGFTDPDPTCLVRPPTRAAEMTWS